MAKLIFDMDRWLFIYTFTCDGHQHLASLHPEHDFWGEVRARNPLLFIIHDLDSVDQPGAAHVAHACEPAHDNEWDITFMTSHGNFTSHTFP